MIENLKSESFECSNNWILEYLICKKIFDKNYDVKKDYLYYKRLEEANRAYININYKGIIDFWWLWNWFIHLVENSLVNN